MDIMSFCRRRRSPRPFLPQSASDLRGRSCLGCAGNRIPYSPRKRGTGPPIAARTLVRTGAHHWRAKASPTWPPRLCDRGNTGKHDGIRPGARPPRTSRAPGPTPLTAPARPTGRPGPARRRSHSGPEIAVPRRQRHGIASAALTGPLTARRPGHRPACPGAPRKGRNDISTLRASLLPRKLMGGPECELKDAVGPAPRSSGAGGPNAGTGANPPARSSGRGRLGQRSSSRRDTRSPGAPARSSCWSAWGWPRRPG